MARSGRYALVAALLALASFPAIAADMPDLEWCDKTGASAMNRRQAEHCAALWWWRKNLNEVEREAEQRKGEIRVLRGSDVEIVNPGQR